MVVCVCVCWFTQMSSMCTCNRKAQWLAYFCYTGWQLFWGVTSFCRKVQRTEREWWNLDGNEGSLSEENGKWSAFKMTWSCKGFFPGSSLCMRQRNMQSRNIVRAEGRSTRKWKALKKFLAHVPFWNRKGSSKWPNGVFHTWTGPSFDTCPFCITRCDKITKENIKKYSTVLTPFDTSNYSNAEINATFFKSILTCKLWNVLHWHFQMQVVTSIGQLF